ncbi:hypothetical protein RB195_025750 [Necator americanus]|uniref:Secreted protein n=1 Tax=Necator americanus TaxID=51031 RepID=A0ABR1ETP9_NECAM
MGRILLLSLLLFGQLQALDSYRNVLQQNSDYKANGYRYGSNRYPVRLPQHRSDGNNRGSVVVREPWYPKHIPYASGGDKGSEKCGRISITKCTNQPGNTKCVQTYIRYDKENCKATVKTWMKTYGTS